MKSSRKVLGHSLGLFIHFLCAAQFARALCCAYLLARLLTRSRVLGEDIFVYELNQSYSYSFNLQCYGGSVCPFVCLFVRLTACNAYCLPLLEAPIYL